MKFIIKLIIILLAFLILILQPVTAQITRGQGKLRGVVKDEQGNPLAGVQVTLHSIRAMSKPLKLKTDQNGQWTAYWIRGGQWNIEFDLPGYYPKRDFIVIAENGTVFEKNINLKTIAELKISKISRKKLDLGFDLFSNRHYEQAMELFVKVLEKAPSVYVINQYIANCLYQLKKWDKAIEHFQKVAQKDPQNHNIHLSLGNCFFQKKEYSQAIQYYQKVLKLRSDHIEALRSIGKSYFNSGNNLKAAEWYKKIDLSLIESATVAYNIGVFYINKGEQKQAVLYLKKAVALKKGFLDALYHLGMSYMGLAKSSEARHVFEKYLQFDNKSQKAKDVREFLKVLKQ